MAQSGEGGRKGCLFRHTEKSDARPLPNAASENIDSGVSDLFAISKKVLSFSIS
jgi:hypothetical protein